MVIFFSICGTICRIVNMLPDISRTHSNKILKLWVSFYWHSPVHGSVHSSAHKRFGPAFFRSTLCRKGNIQLGDGQSDKKKKLNYSDELISIPMLSRSAATTVSLLLMNGCPSGGEQVWLRACDEVRMAQVLNWNVKWRINFEYGTKCSRLFRKIRFFFLVARVQMFFHRQIENIRTNTNWNKRWKKICQFVARSFM